MDRTEFRRDINGLRGLSVLLVVAYHLRLRGADGGFVGVDIFLVISGYLMTRIVGSALEQGRFSYPGFVAARAARIGPALAVMIAILLLLGALALPPFDLATLAAQSGWALLFLSNLHFLDRSGYDTQTADNNWLLHTWSLSVEWQFYLLYPLLLLALGAACRRAWPHGPATRHRAMLAGGVALLLLASLGQHVAGASPERNFFLLPARAWEMLAGGLVWLLQDRWTPPERWRATVASIGLAGVVATVLWLGWRHVPPVGAGWHSVPVVLGVMLLLAAAHDEGFVLGQRWMQALGTWSYSIYLWHWPIVIGLRVFDIVPGRPRLPEAALMAAAAVLCGALSYRWVENRAWRRRSSSPWGVARRPLTLIGVAALLATATVLTDGLDLGPRDRPGFYRGYTASLAPAYFPERCGNFKKPVSELVSCSIVREGPARVLVIGDSHAEHLYAWFARHSQVGVDFFTEAECPPVPRFERAQPGFDCLGYAEAAWARALSGGYDTVVVSARWATVGPDAPPYCHREGGGCVFPPAPQRLVQVRAELQAALQAVLQAGKTVVMLDNAPESPVRVPERVARELFWHGRTTLQLDRQAMLDQGAWMEPLFAAMQPWPGFRRVSLRDQLCSGATCRVYDEALRRPIYLDESHFDPLWIAGHGEVFAPFVQRR